jgi:catechol 2,3-dioxygenase-like lactoylglutathione lyase family enzyme
MGERLTGERLTGGRPSMEVTSLTIGAPDPRRLAAFYAGMLDWSIVHEDPPRPGMPAEDGWAQIRPPAGRSGPTLSFEYEAAYTPPVWPSEAGRQHITQHLDIAVTDLDAAVAHALAAGARLADYQPQDDVRVMLDPAEQPFCLFLTG